METGLVRIAEIARQNPKERFTALIHHINQETLIECHQMVSGSKASGVDQVTKQAYGENLEANIADLIGRMKRQAYKPQPVRRVYIPKEGSNKMRPLGIPSYEDKLVKKGLARILNTIYEQDFLDCSFGFRPGRGCHDALKVLNHIIERKKVNYIVDADIRGFFDHVDHEWLMKFLELLLRLCLSHQHNPCDANHDEFSPSAHHNTVPEHHRSKANLVICVPCKNTPLLDHYIYYSWDSG
jgi:RNA-directed DNA polymerase